MRLMVAMLVASIAFAVPACGAGDADEAHHEAGHEDGHDGEGEHAFTVEEFARYGVTLAVAGPGTVDRGIELPGEVRPNADRLAHVEPRFPGLVREVRVNTGDRVRAGSVLAVVESEHLAPFELRAAFDGTVIDKHIAPGEAIGPDHTVFIIADLSTVWVTIDVYQEALPLVEPGRPVHIVVSPGQLEAEGTVAYVAPVVEETTRTAQARVVLPNTDGRWRPGLFVTAMVFDPIDALVVIPRRAVHTLEGRSVVFVVDGDHFEPRTVTLGATGRTRVEVRRGLAAGERIADENSFLVKAELAKGEGGHDH
ncbi:MAG TPA: efflux RND transporter periplasmic adaptor subunit [Candidatus Limnocylindria bacterium]|nr:efflux RND transporter periplasmic adaptor subunit [Candidatus Limnocylindria bacterium]